MVTDSIKRSAHVVSTDAGVIVGAVIGAIVFFCLIVGLLYYVFSVRGYKLSGLSLPTNTTRVDVVRFLFIFYNYRVLTILNTSSLLQPTFSNPNFGGESDT